MSNIQKSSSIGGTLTGGIQDISALLPLLGTEQCEDHVGSGLSKGFFYSATTPLSIFGSLGMARAGFKAITAAISIPSWNLYGARLLRNSGFGPTGSNLSLIMLDHTNKDRYLAETRLIDMLKKLHIEDASKVTVKSERALWNIMMFLTTFISCVISIAPYVYLNVHHGEGSRPSRTDMITRWTFPVLKALGGLLTATSVQIIIQRRLHVIIKKRLAFMSLDSNVRKLHNLPALPDWGANRASETCLHEMQVYLRNEGDIPEQDPEAQNKANDVETLRERVEAKMSPFTFEKITWLFIVLCLLGNCLLVVGYVGCFSIVQSNITRVGPLIWLVLEVVLSLIRMVVWAWDPRFDELPLTFKLEVNGPLPIPTCDKFSEEIDEEKVLPLVRARQFLQDVTSYSGILERLEDTSLSLYYTLARSRNTLKTVLYIALFDYKDQTTRVYCQDDTRRRIISAAPVTTLEITTGKDIEEEKDTVLHDKRLMSELEKHYKSIVCGLRGARIDQIQTTSALELSGDGESKERDGPVFNYSPEHEIKAGHFGTFQQKWKTHLDNTCGWTMDYTPYSIAFSSHPDIPANVAALILLWEWSTMEWILAEEVYIYWTLFLTGHKLVWTRSKQGSGMEKVLKGLFGPSTTESARAYLRRKRDTTSQRLVVDRRRLAGLYKRQTAELSEKLDDFESQGELVARDITEKWKSTCDYNIGEEIAPVAQRLETRLQSLRDDLETKTRSLLEDARMSLEGMRIEMDKRVQARVKAMDRRLQSGWETLRELRYRLFDRKFTPRWPRFTPKLIRDYGVEIVSQAAKGDRDAVFIEFSLFESDEELSRAVAMTREMPWLTSLYFWHCSMGHQTYQALLEVVQKNPSILSISGETLLGPMMPPIIEGLESNRANATQRTTISFNGYTTCSAADYIFSFPPNYFNITVRFLGPTEHDLCLSCTHQCSDDDASLLIECPQKRFQHPVPRTITTETIHLRRGEHFNPGKQNTIVITPPRFHHVRYLELVDQNGLPYNRGDWLDIQKFGAHRSLAKESVPTSSQPSPSI